MNVFFKTTLGDFTLKLDNRKVSNNLVKTFYTMSKINFILIQSSTE